MSLFLLIQNLDVSEKIKNAPDESYQIGVVIGSFIPVVLLIGVAYFLYYYNKKRD
ncbi:hypothetical protein ACRASX_03785 [Flavobacterium sp. TMP13]|uniref:hypothetical protein n=1 Tax=unclassified Flavobacterium TaxID=196869 RepID=UPI00076DC068|nr:hypothetical protein [Flavobacterium sp. TAB 87]KVV13214.1 hypothetical protein AP058_02576 [Flavobacterium sp. TAB 87]